MLKGFTISQERLRRQLEASESPGLVRIAAGESASDTERLLLGILSGH